MLSPTEEDAEGAEGGHAVQAFRRRRRGTLDGLSLLSGEPPRKPTSRRFCRARFSTSVVWTVPIVGGAAVFAKKPMPWTRR